MKARNLTVLAVVATGALALAAPSAFAAEAQGAKKKSSFESRTNKDIKRLGDNVKDLRKKDDETNATIGKLAETAADSLTQLKDGLSSLSASYGNFQYGAVQLSYGSVPGAVKPLASAAFPFAETPRLDPTRQGSTVSATFVKPAGVSGTISAYATVRSVKDPKVADNESTAYCRVAFLNETTGEFRTTRPNDDAKKLPYTAIQRSPLKPTDPNEELNSVVGMSTDDMKTAVDLLGGNKVWAAPAGVPDTSAPTAGAGVETYQVTLTCLRIENSVLEDKGITPPFKT